MKVVEVGKGRLISPNVYCLPFWAEYTRPCKIGPRRIHQGFLGGCYHMRHSSVIFPGHFSHERRLPFVVNILSLPSL